MGAVLLARSRGLAGSCAALVAVALAGCTAAGSSAPSITGRTLSIYVSAPASAASDPEAQDVLYAEKLAFQQQQAQVTAFKLRLQPVVSAKLSANARNAVGDQTTVAYLGEVPPGGSADSLGITNALDVLQVSPTDTAGELTQKTPAIPDAPQRYYESLSTYGRTFARVVPTTFQEARALVKQMRSVGVKSLYVAGDGSEYGLTLAVSLRNAASAAGISVASAQTGAAAVAFAGSSQSQATQVFNTAAAATPTVKLYAPSALDNDAFASGLSAAAQKALSVSAPGVLPKQLVATDGSFVSAFRTAYGHAPSPEAAFGYEAMSAVLAILKQAGSSANNRTTVKNDFFAIKNRGFLGTSYSINGNGDTSIAPFVIERVSAGKLVPFKAIQAPG
jgi:hypothetical protein